MSNETQAFTISQFCALHNISRSTFYNILKDGQAPVIMRLGRRRLITAEAAQAWRERMTKLSAVETAREGA